MYSDVKYIAPDLSSTIKEAANMLEVIEDYVSLQKKGSSYQGDCPCCNAPKKFSVSDAKQIWKCWTCDETGKDAVSFLMKTQGLNYVDSLKLLAQKYNIAIEQQNEDTSSVEKRQGKFRDAQLRASGIPQTKQKYHLFEGDISTEYDRYQAASIDKFWNVVPGDDMILHYIDLDMNPIVFQDQQKKRRNLIRVRWANPNHHKDKTGRPVKYQSPFKSGSHLWLPTELIKSYQAKNKYSTLYICEGEKKATKMCLSGMPTVGIMGIHNFSIEGQMSLMFSQLIKRAEVQQVVFLLDADWQDISTKGVKAVDTRPKTFFSAVRKFRDYFAAYRHEGIELNLFFGYHRDKLHKGIDDLLVMELKSKGKELSDDFLIAMSSREGKGDHVQLHNVTTMSEYKMQEFWNLHSQPAFLNAHKEELKKMGEFTYRSIRRRYNEEEDRFELAQALLPREQYWLEEVQVNRNGDEKTTLKFDYYQVNIFLRNRGFGLLPTNGTDDYRLVHMNGRVVTETTPHKIQRFVTDFTENIERYDVLRMMYSGGEQYLGPKKLSNMRYLNPAFMQPEKDCQYLYFKNSYWKISAEGIEQRPLSELPNYIWKNTVIDFEPTYLGQPMAKVKDVKGKIDFTYHKKMEDCDMAKFYQATSMFFWKKQQKLVSIDGQKRWVEKENPEPLTTKDFEMYKANLLAKMIAAGYVLHDYKDRSQMKAVICMDGQESEVGKSKGGTGKSLWATMFQHLVPTEVIDGKKKNLNEDQFIYENVDERTKIIVMDDVRVNFDFEALFSQITNSVEVNKKGQAKFKIEPPRFIIPTNHAINGDDNSFRRRQYLISFCDYFNEHRRVSDEFGRQFFYEWDNQQWNLFYNWLATCLQVYFQFGLSYTIPQHDIERRKLRQQIGENALEFFGNVYDTKPDDDGRVGIFLNRKVEKDYLFEKFLAKYPNDKKYMDPRKFKKIVKLYCQYAELDFNPGYGNKRIKSGGLEFVIVANDDFDKSNVPLVRSDNDIRILF